jgi:hypothetical protein
MYGQYEFPNVPREIITQLIIPYQSGGTYNILTVDVPDTVHGGLLKDTLSVRRPKTIYASGATSLASAQEVADAWCAQYGNPTPPQRGTVNTSMYPMFTKGANTYFIYSGNVVHVHHSLVSAVNNRDMLVVEVEYREPESTSTIKLLSLDAGFNDNTYDINDAIKAQNEKAYGATEMAGSYEALSIPAGALHRSTQPFQTTFTWSVGAIGGANASRVYWVTAGGAKSIVFQNGDSYVTTDGNYNTNGDATAVYFYLLNSESYATMHTTTNYLTAMADGAACVAVAERAPDANSNAYVYPVNGKAGVISSLMVLTNFVQAGMLAANLVLATNIIAGGIKGGGSAGVTLNSAGIEGYDAAAVTQFSMSAATGKVTGISVDTGVFTIYNGATKIGSILSYGAYFALSTEAGKAVEIQGNGTGATLRANAGAAVVTATSGEGRLVGSSNALVTATAGYVIISAGTDINLTAGGSNIIHMYAGHIEADDTAYIKFPRQSGNPLSPEAGWVYYDTADNALKYWNGGAWIVC